MIAERLALYKSILREWNRRINLVGPEAAANLDAHVEEALMAASILAPFRRVLDVGSGGGLPAIPMAIAEPDAEFELVERDRRKWAFLKHVIRELGLNCRVHGDSLRAVLEQLDASVHFDLVTSRAVGRYDEWLAAAAERLTEGGRAALFIGREPAPAAVNLRLVAEHKLPRGDDNRLVVMAVVPRGTWEKS